MESTHPLLAAVQAVNPRTQARLAQLCGVVPMTISQWLRRGVPARRCVAIERVTQGKVTRYALRPDVFGAGPG
jgi:DNA-binding transcriptional regulator YdaS (Cro superfamily)